MSKFSLQARLNMSAAAKMRKPITKKKYLIKAIKRFESYVNKKGSNECWLWQGSVNRDGYGNMRMRDKITGAHRLAYEFYIGSIPKSKEVCHSCDTPHCVNPKHLWLGTHLNNISDRHKKGRDQRGESHSRAKLTEKKVVNIRNSTLSKTELAKLYNVSEATVRHIITRRYWKHLK